MANLMRRSVNGIESNAGVKERRETSHRSVLRIQLLAQRGLIGWWSCPWPALDNRFRICLALRADVAEVTFLDGPRAG